LCTGKDLVVKAPLDAKLNIFEEAIDAGKVRQAAASAMAAASVKAKLLANQEEREMQRLVTIVIENQVSS
jgi:SWI/SNF related-matrix-associated actin-dependent regulator of chromatin subfamily C